MDRRDLLKMITVATGAAMVGGNVFGYELKSQLTLSDTLFSQDDLILFNEIAEVILPRTDTPGAKDANVGLMAMILATDCYSPAARESFKKGLHAVDADTQEQYGKPFLLLSPEQKTEFVRGLDIQANTYNKKQDIHYMSVRPDGDQPLPHYFTMIKQLTLFSFFTSKLGMTKVLRYDAIPGKYNGELDYKKGDRAWAT
ncbi:gluconate 2-dehydrogenase subunit 3 family protein [Neptunicella sp. SCSIO 80796]|uniref:gluconate 2-dehydrogenase subunit 3 family protein n=1 Tax=Neptunicella plasticusilytica TaxID=3117012 RepID=UPI003A4E406B